jgi:hypothetical protein
MTGRARVLWFGSAALLLAAGIALAATTSSTAGQVVGIVASGIALVVATSLVFLEVGLSEDRERAARERNAERDVADRERLRQRRPRLGPPRTRGHRRRIK